MMPMKSDMSPRISKKKIKEIGVLLQYKYTTMISKYIIVRLLSLIMQYKQRNNLYRITRLKQTQLLIHPQKRFQMILAVNSGIKIDPYTDCVIKSKQSKRNKYKSLLFSKNCYDELNCIPEREKKEKMIWKDEEITEKCDEFVFNIYDEFPEIDENRSVKKVITFTDAESISSFNSRYSINNRNDSSISKNSK